MRFKNDTKNHAKVREEARAWWVRMDSDSVDLEERSVFEQWLKADPLHELAYDEVNSLWKELDGIKNRLLVTPLDTTKDKTIFPGWQWGLLAFGLCCVLVLAMNPLAVFLRADFVTGIGETRKLQLQDGSTVFLNCQTALAVNFNTSERHLTLLQGEALFQVSPDRDRPFRVLAGNGTITALGTEFDVRLKDTGAEVTVSEHSVMVNIDQNHTDNKKIIISSGQQLRYSDGSGQGEIISVDTHAATAWRRGKLIFQDKPLGEVIAELNKHHRGYFVISDAQITSRRINGVFPTEKPVEALNALEKSLQLHSTRLSDDWILLHH